MKITKVIFLPKSKKCLSLTIKVYYVQDEDHAYAKEKATEKFKSECDDYSLYNEPIVSNIEVIE